MLTSPDFRDLLRRFADAEVRYQLADVATHVYTSGMKASKAKLFRNGGSQAVRLPRDCRFPESEKVVLVRRVGRTVVLEPIDEWPDGFLRSLGSLSEDIERPPSPSITKLRDPFA
jgi:antitoxin VapB